MARQCLHGWGASTARPGAPWSCLERRRTVRGLVQRARLPRNPSEGCGLVVVGLLAAVPAQVVVTALGDRVPAGALTEAHGALRVPSRRRWRLRGAVGGLPVPLAV